MYLFFICKSYFWQIQKFYMEQNNKKSFFFIISLYIFSEENVIKHTDLNFV